MKSFKEIRQQINEFKEIRRRGGGGERNDHEEMVKTLSNHFENIHGVKPKTSSAGEDDSLVTIIHHPDVKHEYSVNGSTEPVALRSHPNGEHTVLDVNTNTRRVKIAGEEKPKENPFDEFMRNRNKKP
mgnify:FL=1